MKALVTGGGGFLGGAVVDALLARGDDVVSLARGDYPGLRERGVATVRGDLADPTVVRDAVAVVRMTREHADVRQGSSVRGAIDLALMVQRLCALRSIEPGDDEAYRATFLEIMMVALSGRLLIEEAAETDAAAVLRDIWERYFILDLAAAQPG